MRQFLVGKRANATGVELNDVAGTTERAWQNLFLLGRDVHRLRNTSPQFGEPARSLTQIELHQWRRGNDHEVRRNRLRFAPTRERAPSFSHWQGPTFDERAVRNHRFAERRGHRPADRRLLARMVEARNPVAKAVWPVVESKSTGLQYPYGRSIRR